MSCSTKSWHDVMISWALSPSSGSPEHGALCWPEQPHQAVAGVPPVDRPHHGGVLLPGGQGEGERHWDQPHVWQTKRLSGEEPGTVQASITFSPKLTHRTVLTQHRWTFDSPICICSCLYFECRSIALPWAIRIRNTKSPNTMNV